MTNIIFNLKKEIEELSNKKENLKWTNCKVNFIIFLTLLTYCLIFKNYLNIKHMLVSIPIISIVFTSISLKINFKRLKEIKEIKRNIKLKQDDLDNKIKSEILIRNLKTVKEINKNIEYDSLEQFVINRKLQNNYYKNVKKVKKRVKRKER